MSIEHHDTGLNDADDWLHRNDSYTRSNRTMRTSNNRTMHRTHVANPNTAETGIATTDETGMVSAVDVSAARKETQFNYARHLFRYISINSEINLNPVFCGYSALHYQPPVIGTNVSCFTQERDLAYFIGE